MKRLYSVSLVGNRLGGVMVMTLLSAVFMLSMVALVTDVGYLYYNQARLQTAVNAGWKAGFDKLAQFERGTPLTPEEKTAVRNHILEVMMANGYTAEEMEHGEKVHIAFDVATYGIELDVRATHDVGLFFAKIMNKNSAEVAAARSDEDKTAGIVPLGIPHGVVKDYSRSYYNVDLFADNAGFTVDKEYIIKLGSGEGPPDQTALLVPMDSGSQSISGYRHAYGAAFWCLQIDDADANHFAPVYWLLGYRGGAFLLTDAPQVRSKLNQYGVNFEVVTGNSNINAIFETVGDHVMEVHKRPRIAVYSSTNNPDPVEMILRNSKIPYGPYSLPPATGGWARNAAFVEGNCSSFYDEGILSGEINKYHWLHLHHEDFTGFSGGCKRWKNSPSGSSSDPDCKQNYDNGLYGYTNSTSRREAASEYFCDYCHDRFDPSSGSFGTKDTTLNIGDSYANVYARFYADGRAIRVESSRTIYKIILTFTDNNTQTFDYSSGSERTVSGYGSNNGKTIKAIMVRTGRYSSSYREYSANSPIDVNMIYDNGNCRHYKRRCAEFATYKWWEEYERVNPAVPDSSFDEYLYRNSPRSQLRSYICYSDDTRPNCRGYSRVYDIATDFGFTDESGSVPKPQTRVGGSDNLALQEPGWFNKGNRVQMMKWEVVEIVKNHVKSGGFLFAQCFAPETFDMALFQRGIHLGKTPTDAYQDTLAFTDFAYADTPLGDIPLKYSTINTREYSNKVQTASLNYPYDPRTQNHGNFDTSTGHTASFLRSTIKTSSNIKILGTRTNNNNWVKYLGGEIGNGVFSFLGGHYHKDIRAERLVLNNILFGSTSTKEVTEGPESSLGGRRKHGYGPIDPSNTLVDDATETNNYSNNLKYGFNDPLQLNDRLGTIPGKNMAAITQDAIMERILATATRVIIPITRIGPEIPTNSATNSAAISIYDLQGRDNASGIYDPALYGFEASVQIIGFAEFEIVSRDDYTRSGRTVDEDGNPYDDPKFLEGDNGDLGAYQTGQVRGNFIRYIVDPREMTEMLK